jgi:hypothetical protein
MAQAEQTGRQWTNFDDRVPWSTTRRLRPRPAPADPADPDAMEELGDRIAVLTAQISAATHQLLVLIAEFDGLRGWEAGGHRSCAHWLAASRSAPISGTRAARYQVILHVDAAALAADPGSDDGGGCPHVSRERSEHHDSSHLEDGTRVSHESTRRICCDASLVRVTRDANGGLLDIGRRTRTIPPALRRALELRDGGCRFPGCGLRFTDGHHVRHWIDGGATSLANCVLLCSHHHRLMHEGGWRVEFWGREVPVFIDPRGNQHCDGRPLTAKLPAQPVESLIREQRRRGVRAHAGSLGAHWRSEAHVPDELWHRVSEAL